MPKILIKPIEVTSRDPLLQINITELAQGETIFEAHSLPEQVQFSDEEAVITGLIHSAIRLQRLQEKS